MLKRWFLVIGVIAVMAGGALAAALVVSDASSPSQAASTVSIDTIQLAANNTEAAESMQFELRSSDGLGLSASGVVSGDGQLGQVSVTVGTLVDVEERIVDGTVYVQTGGMVDDADGHWLAISLDRLGDFGSSFGGAPTPTGALDMLDQAAGPVETVGDDTVAGHHATHYRVTVDADGTPTPVDVWIDDNDRVVRIHGTAPDGGEITFEVTAFGVPVDVQAPPSDQVVEFPGRSSRFGTGVI